MMLDAETFRRLIEELWTSRYEPTTIEVIYTDYHQTHHVVPAEEDYIIIRLLQEKATGQLYIHVTGATAEQMANNLDLFLAVHQVAAGIFDRHVERGLLDA